MTRRQIAAERAGTAFELRYNLFQRKGQPDLCCAVPEDRPVPSFVTGKRWDFEGTWEGATPPREGATPPPGLNPTAAELGVCLNGFHLFQIAGPLESLRVSEYRARRAVCGEPARGEEFELRLDNGRDVLLLFNSSPLRDATGAVIGVDTRSAVGKCFLDMLGVFAEFETNLRRERQLDGIKAAKERGVYAGKGRKPTVPVEKVKAMRAEGHGPSAIAKALGISRMNVHRALAA